MYSAINQVAPDAKFSLFTGDVVDHAVWLTTQAQNTMDITDAYTRMSKLGLIYGTIGNHEQSPVNQFQPNSVGTGAKWIYTLLGSIWSKWIDATALSNQQSTGAYSTKVPNTNLRIISLNTNIYYRSNFWLDQKTMEQDPNGQLAWLLNELQGAENAKERVYIMGHMPMGLPDCLRDASNLFDQLVNRYSGTIAALFFGVLTVFNVKQFTNLAQVTPTKTNFKSHIRTTMLEASPRRRPCLIFNRLSRPPTACLLSVCTPLTRSPLAFLTLSRTSPT
jgi:sphingomyelin phosphodiesterase